MMEVIHIPPNEVVGNNDCKRQQYTKNLLQKEENHTFL